jgi:small subunit ribosomal protein S27Ae
MAAPAVQKKTEKKATTGRWKKYDITGGVLKRKGRPCPKCGSGVWLAEHKDRLSCGKCNYTEFKSKK